MTLDGRKNAKRKLWVFSQGLGQAVETVKAKHSQQPWAVLLYWYFWYNQASLVSFIFYVFILGNLSALRALCGINAELFVKHT
ncbi:hypothetical protein [Photobacterium ganghwense]|uniref:hypothetical protein n=1 Tax=Photobacterium ganghwense TaxID=320778 RepID=UPI0039F0975A